MELKDLKAGDKVIVVDTRYGASKEIRTIEKITPKGFIKVDGILYYNTGYAVGKHMRKYIEFLSQEEEEKMLLESKRKITIFNCKKLLEERTDNLSYDDAKEILEILLKTK